jgi:HprK-related kinase A
VQSALPAVAEGISLLYADHEVRGSADFADFHVRVDRPLGLRRWLNPQVVFRFDGAPPFHPLPGDQGFPLLEWGLNWCISGHLHQYLIIHAAAVERGGRALLLPAPPGSGKSTLCAALVSRGWRLLSDELALISPETGNVVPLVRAISLKNASIAVIGRFARAMRIGPAVHDTLKGSVAHVKPPIESVQQQADPATPRWVVKPRYAAGEPARLQACAKGQTFIQLADSAFNYEVHGRRGFDLIGDLVASCDCYELSYSDLEEAVGMFNDLAAAA